MIFMVSIALTGLLSLCLTSTPAQAYIVDGVVSDWGVNLNDANAGNLGYLNTNVPTTGARYAVDDDDWAGNPNYVFVGPGYSRMNEGDAEATYIDNDSNYLYFAVITGTPKTWSGYAPYSAHPSHGDIFFSTDNDLSNYEYGLKIAYGPDTAGLYENFNTIGSDPQFSHGAADPWIIGSIGDLIVDPNLLFFSNGTAQNSHYVLEGRISLAALGLDSSTASQVQIHWTMECGNDVIPPVVPEPTTISLLGVGLLGLIFKKKRAA